jgi:type II secretory ATPase GspE/PulE/Tfp pilus assembly ATPase PilB-like protein
MICEDFLDHFSGQDPSDVRSYIRVAHRIGSSDIHFEPLETSLRVRARVEGHLIELAKLPHKAGPKKPHPLCIQLKAQSGLNLQSRVAEDGRLGVDCDGTTVNLRISTMPLVHGENVVCRLFDVARIESLGGLDFRPTNREKLESMIGRRSGLVLVSGPTGSGKTTTLYAVLKSLNKENLHLVTVEDPVEYFFEGVSQVQVSQSGVDFADALRSILRQDPDIIMIGEIRDRETAAIASQAAMTGHLVLSTVHANDSVSALMRLMELDVPPIVLAQALNGVIAQRLLPRLCQCRTRLTQEPFPTLQTHAPGACEKCQDGYLGRCGIQEVLVLNDQLRRLVASELEEDELRAVSLKLGLETLKEDAVWKSIQGDVALRDAVGVTDEGLHRLLSNLDFFENGQ